MKALLFVVLFATATLTAFAQTDTPTPSDIVLLGHGLNLGNFLEAPSEGAWNGGRRLQESDFKLIHDAGLSLVRVPISWSAHAGSAPDYTIDSAFLARVDWIVAQAQSNNLQAILDYHNDDALMHDPAANGPRFVALWKQIAEHFKSAPSSILFELLNEPNGKLDDDQWNTLLAKTIPVIRASNPTRTLIVGPTEWNSIRALPKLVLPAADNRLIVTFHYYDPMKFTHQGASWIQGSDPWLGTKWEGTPAEEKAITDAFDQAAAWGKAHNRPMYLGEFGAFEKGDMESRSRWTRAVVHSAEAHSFAWTYWEFSAGFGVYDPAAKQWRIDLLDALLQRRS